MLAPAPNGGSGGPPCLGARLESLVGPLREEPALCVPSRLPDQLAEKLFLCLRIQVVEPDVRLCTSEFESVDLNAVWGVVRIDEAVVPVRGPREGLIRVVVRNLLRCRRVGEVDD